MPKSRSPRTARKRKPLSQLPLEDTINGAAKRSRPASESPINDDTTSSVQRRAGTINFIKLRNFMCHSLLEVDLQKSNISMMIGKNGSGKSAILTALIVGLGGKANLTNRGSSVKSFVKVGKPSGSIEIQLCNEGPMAYRPKEYGKFISITRNVNASGGGSYRVKAANGTVISTQAKEVINITTNLNIQVDNPVCLLTQDTARNFLSSSDPKKKFSLFIRATKLEMLDSEFKNIINNKKEAARMLEVKKEHLSKLEDELRRLKRKLDGHQSVVALKEKKSALHKEMQWAQVCDAEKELADEQKKVDKIAKKLLEFQSGTDKKGQQIQELQEAIQELERQITELRKELEIHRQPQADAKEELERLQHALMEVKRNRQGIAIEISSKGKDVEYMRQEVKNANENMSKMEQLKRDRLNNLSKLQDRLKSLNERLETSRNELFQVKNDVSRKQEDAEGLKTEIRQIDQRISQEESSLKALQKEQGNTLMLYGRNIPKIKEMIRRQSHLFKHEPKGPLGSYMKLGDKKWAVAVEGYLGGSTLGAFTVDNQKDGKLLQQVFSSCLEGESQPTIITSKFLNNKHDVRNNLVQAPNGCISMYDAITIDDPVVSNCIVDQMSPENVLLVPDDKTAIELMSNRRNVPRNCKQSVTIKGDKYYPDPKYKTYASNYHKARYLQIDTKEHMQHLQENIAAMKNRRHGIQNQLQALQADIHSRSNMQREIEDKIRRDSADKQHLKTRFEELNSEAEPEAHDLNQLENELRCINGVLEEKRVLLSRADEEMRDLKTKITAQEEKMSKLRRASKALEERLWPLQEEIKEKQSKQRQLSANSDNDKQRLNEYERKVRDARSEVVVKQNVVAAKTADAEKLSERPPEVRSVLEISKDIQGISINIAKIETDSDDIQEVSQEYEQLSEKHSSVKGVIRESSRNLKDLEKAIDLRKNHYKLTENYFVTFMKHSFKKILEFRQFKGNLDINMDQKKLELIVMPQQGSQGLTTTSNLSGGERSFSTVAFLYALWQCMDFPFYFLDEFDVYMDKLNRTKVIEILLHHAKSKPDLQFVFLTPQDVSFIPEYVSVLRLEDPERFNV